MSSHTNRQRKKPELLAPAGGLAQLRAAVNNGADAVYLGGSRFNARGKAENFTLPRLRDAIAYAHERNVKIYVTFNTLLKDRELPVALEYGVDLYDIGADAVIVQDMGLVRLLHRYVPDLPLHLSTQATVYNPQAVDLIKEMGICRVVPARELTLEEIRAFAAACHGTQRVSAGHSSEESGPSPERPMPPCEVEVFVHGALCMCYSGQCQMSRLLGGSDGSGGARSGNRGLCAQPCRLPYTDDRGRTGYWLSPKDLCLLEEIPALCEAGADSFKIEGRLKSPEYVAITTSIYRKYIDAYAKAGQVKVDPADMDALRQIFHRGGFTNGYLYENPGEEILSGETPKNAGIFVGQVRSLTSEKEAGKAGRGAARKGAALVDVALTGELSEGDGVEIRPERPQDHPGRGTVYVPAGGLVTYFEELPEAGKRAAGGKTRKKSQQKTSEDSGAAQRLVRIGDMKGRIEPGDRVFKVTDRKQLQLARESFDAEDPQELDRRMKRRIPVQMTFSAVAGVPAELVIREGCARKSGAEGLFEVRVCSEEPLEQALKRPADPERIQAQLAKLGGTPFEAGPEDILVQTDGKCAVPIAEINRMRREGIDQLLREKRTVRRDSLDEVELVRTCETLTDRHLQLPDEAAYGKPVPLEEFMAGAEGLPYLGAVTKGKQDAYIAAHFDEIVARLAGCGILINNPGWIRQFQEAGVKVYGGHGLNVFNEQARLAFEEMGVEVIEGSHEMVQVPRRSGKSEEEHKKSGSMQLPAGSERDPEGGIPLMITEHPVRSTTLTDRKGQVHRVGKSPSGDKTIIW